MLCIARWNLINPNSPVYSSSLLQFINASPVISLAGVFLLIIFHIKHLAIHIERCFSSYPAVFLRRQKNAVADIMAAVLMLK